jgi:hypothetical protein
VDVARKLSNIEKIARDICWAEFTHPLSRKGKTKASHWNDISDRARQEFIREAERLIWVIRVLPIDTLNLAHGWTRPTTHKGERG